MTNSPLTELSRLGQSIWYDNIERKLITSGELKRLIDEDDLRGVTSNPAIFEKAISSSELYSDQLSRLAEEGKSPLEIYEELAITDVQSAADVLREVYDRTEGGDGFVSLECSPKLANDTEATIQEARRLWKRLDRPNVMIKIPGTPAGMPAIEQCTFEGININITLLFSLEAYDQTIEAYLRGLERRVDGGKPLASIASVASFFVSRIDTAVDKQLQSLVDKTTDEAKRKTLQSLMGRIATANAKLAYQKFKAVFDGPRFAKLAEKGARVQRPLWASTSTKNPDYSDVYYVESLIGPRTIDTLPPATLVAFRDHGVAKVTIEDNLDEERAKLAALEAAGISLDQATRQVLEDGVRLFVEPFEKLLTTIQSRRQQIAERRASGTATD
jgi:transaldolase/glucose-6-phosphate isomerase